MELTAAQIAFINEYIRPNSNRLLSLTHDIEAAMERYYALGMSSVFPGDGSTINDGAPDNGQPPITGTSVADTAANFEAFITFMSSARRSVLQSVAVNP